MRFPAATALLVVMMVALGGGMGGAWAGWDEGLAAYEKGDYATALREWKPLAEQGDAAALLAHDARLRLSGIWGPAERTCES